MPTTIGIVGAGLSGLVTAKTLLEYGHRVIVFEKDAEPGGVWAGSRHYPGLTTQNTRDSYAFSDFPMPRHYPEFPGGEQMRHYLHGYARHFGVWPHIRTRTVVESAVPLTGEDRGGWLLHGTREGYAFTERVDFLVVCNGTFSEPFIPTSPGMDHFTAAGGRILHSTEVGGPATYRGKKVVVVGYGKSACDVASSIADEAHSTTIVYRQAKWKVPKRILGINYKYLILSRFGEALTKLRYRNGAERLIHALRLPGFILRRMENIFARQQQLNACGLRPDLPISDLLFGELSVESDGFFEKVRNGCIRALPGGIREFRAGGLTLGDGTVLEADLVVYGTGFRQNIPFFESGLLQKLTDARGNFQLHRNILPPEVAELAFVGYNTSFFCNLTSEIAAQWLAEYLEGHIALPERDKMLADIREHQEWRAQFRRNALYRGTSVYPFNITYVDWLLRDMNARLPWPSLLAEWLVVIDPAHYAPVKRRIRQRSLHQRTAAKPRKENAGQQVSLPED